jgi:hypothetical protein
VLETKVVALAVPERTMTLVGTKLDPLTVMVKAAPPVSTGVGVRDESVGTGLLTMKVTADDVPPPGAGVETVTLLEAPAATSAALIDACN